MNDKKILSKLIKIAQNQQKIINKLAQDVGYVPPADQQGGATTGWSDVKDDVEDKLKAIPGSDKYSVVEAKVGSTQGDVQGKIQFPPNDQNYYKVLKQLKDSLIQAGKLRTADGKMAQVTKDPHAINFTGMSG